MSPTPNDSSMLANAFELLHLSPGDPSEFKTREAWTAFEYRDLGMAAQTDGRVGAFHMRALGPARVNRDGTTINSTSTWSISSRGP